MRRRYASAMTMLLSLLLSAGSALGMPTAAHDQHGDARAAREARMAGRLLPLREIERRVVPGMAGSQYIGFDFDSGSGIYTLKFLRNGNVIWVTVDGRSGAILGRTGR
jgi:hypothetical protein